MIAEMAGQKQNIVQAIKDYGRQLLGFIRGRVDTAEDAEDILQDVWYQFSSQARLEDIESISGWLYQVAKNRITDNRRKKKSVSLPGYAGDEGEEGWMVPAFMTEKTNDAETIYLQKIFRETFFEALQELPENQRTVFVRHELEGMTLQEIADNDGDNIKTIISRKRYAVSHLRKRLEFLYNDLLID